LKGFAQDPCTDAAGITAMRTEFNRLYELKGLENRKSAIAVGKQFLEKYGTCEAGKDLSDYLKTNLSKIQENYDKAIAADLKEKLYKRFDASVRASNFDETFASGKEILAQEPDNLDVIIILATIGYNESYKKNFRYNAESTSFAKQAISMIAAGKSTPTFGNFSQFRLKNKENALGLLNYYIGYMQFYGDKNRKESLQYFYAATQHQSEARTEPVLYDSIGLYFIGESDTLQDEIAALRKARLDTDPDDVKKKKDDEMDAKAAMAYGLLERVLDTYSRAYSSVDDGDKNKPYKARLYGTLQKAYVARFGKSDGLDAWMAASAAKPMPDPASPVAPVIDTPPSAPGTDPAAATKPTVTTVKPTGTKPVKPPAKPVKVKKPVTKKKKS
jgi:hypothetical protein